jgi:hypothetical protein
LVYISQCYSQKSVWFQLLQRTLYKGTIHESKSRAFEASRIMSKLVWGCWQGIYALSNRNKVTLFWVHTSGIQGNEGADTLTRKGSVCLFFNAELQFQTHHVMAGSRLRNCSLRSTPITGLPCLSLGSHASSLKGLWKNCLGHSGLSTLRCQLHAVVLSGNVDRRRNLYYIHC